MKRLVKRFSVLLPVLLLTGCFHLPVERSFPEAPKTLMEKCPELDIITEEKVTVKDFEKVTVKNYSKRHECAAKVDGWIEWYVKQKQIFDSVK